VNTNSEMNHNEKINVLPPEILISPEDFEFQHINITVSIKSWVLNLLFT